MNTRMNTRMNTQHRLFAPATLIAMCVVACTLTTVRDALAVPVVGTSLIAHYDAANVNVGATVTWPNLSNALGVNQSTLDASAALANAPSVVSGATTSGVGGIGGLPALRFERTSTDRLVSGTLGTPIALPKTVIFVGRLNGAVTTSDFWYDGSVSTERVAYLHSGQKAWIYNGAGSITSVSDVPLNEFNIWTTTYQANNVSLNLNGSPFALSGSNAGAQLFSGLTFGKHVTSANNYLNGDIAEFLVFDGLLDAEDFNTVGAFLEAKFGLDTAFIQPPPPVIPEPSSLLLLGLGTLGLVRHTRRRRRRA